MILLQGKGVSPGVAEGKLVFFRRRSGKATARKTGAPDKELSRLVEAQTRTVAQLEGMARRCRDEGREEAAVLLETHAALVEDEDYVQCIHSLIREERVSAEQAVQAAGERFAGVFAGMEDAYMQERAADILDVSRRLTDNLTGAEQQGIVLDAPAIIAADDLAPSETIQLDRAMVLAFVTRGGSANSHTAILARNMGIPAVCGLGDALRESYAGRVAHVDGANGRVIFRPNAAVLAELKEKQLRQEADAALRLGVKGKADVTRDGRRIDVCCNIGSPADIPAVLENDARAIGLFRSEFLYLAAEDYPDEETQLEAYRAAAERMNGGRVVIRTLDVGADKQAPYLGLTEEENPALGMRGVRVCLSRPEMFRTQLRAIYRASAFGQVAILLPMVASVWEVRECRRLCREVMQALRREDVPFRQETEIGVMIETPAAALIARELAEEADFFSIGTNDLTQYVLACDRQSGELDRYYDPYHPAVLRAVKLAADAAHAAGIRVAVCGDLGADARALPALIAMGIDAVSVPPPAVLKVRAAIRALRAADCSMEIPEG